MRRLTGQIKIINGWEKWPANDAIQKMVTHHVESNCHFYAFCTTSLWTDLTIFMSLILQVMNRKMVAFSIHGQAECSSSLTFLEEPILSAMKRETKFVKTITVMMPNLLNSMTDTIWRT